MPTIHRYVLRQLLATLGLCVLVFTFLLVLGNALKEILDLLASRQATFLVVLKALALLLPFVVAFSLPMSLLTAVLLVFGRLSADQELTAMKAGGIRLVQVSLPVLVLATAISGLCGYFNLELAPRSRQDFKRLFQTVLRERAAAGLLRDNTYVQLPDLDLYVTRARGTNLSELLLYRYTNGVKWLECRAERAYVEPDTNGLPQTLVLLEANAIHRLETNEGWNTVFFSEYPVSLPDRMRADSVPLDNMTFRELAAVRERLRGRGSDDTPVLVHMHRQLAFTFASIGFALLGIPLAIRAHRRETNKGVALALALVLVYYSFTIAGHALQTSAVFRPHLILWAPNFLFQGLGAFLLWRVDRQ